MVTPEWHMQGGNETDTAFCATLPSQDLSEREVNIYNHSFISQRVKSLGI